MYVAGLCVRGRAEPRRGPDLGVGAEGRLLFPLDQSGPSVEAALCRLAQVEEVGPVPGTCVSAPGWG